LLVHISTLFLSISLFKKKIWIKMSRQLMHIELQSNLISKSGPKLDVNIESIIFILIE